MSLRVVSTLEVTVAAGTPRLMSREPHQRYDSASDHHDDHERVGAELLVRVRRCYAGQLGCGADSSPSVEALPFRDALFVTSVRHGATYTSQVFTRPGTGGQNSLLRPPWPYVLGLLLTVGLVGVVLLVSQGGRDRYTAMPSSALPTTGAVSVLASAGYEGQSCCEAHAASRAWWVSVQASSGDRAVEVVADGLLSAGFQSTPCVPGTVARCFENGGFFSQVSQHGPEVTRRGADVYVWMERT